MKNQNRTLIFILLFIAILVCFDLTSYSNDLPQNYWTVFSQGANSNENRINSEMNSFNDDQIPQYNKDSSIVKSIRLIQFLYNPLIKQGYTILIWQPPKIN